MNTYTLMAWLEHSVTPAILCHPDGQIIYRNPSTRFSGIGPRVGAGLLRYLKATDGELFTQAARTNQAAILNLPANDTSRKMLLLPFFTNDEEPLLLLLGLMILHSPDFSPTLLREQGTKLLAMFTNYFRISRKAIEHPLSPAQCRLMDLSAKLLSMSFSDNADFWLDMNSAIRLNMQSAGDVLHRFCNDTLLPLGIKLSVSVQDLTPTQKCFNHGNAWLMTVLGISLCFLGLIGQTEGTMLLYEQQEHLHFGLELKANKEPLLGLKSNGDGTPLLMRMAKEYPVWSAELSALTEICNRHSWIPMAFPLKDQKIYLDMQGEWLTHTTVLRARDDAELSDAVYRSFLMEMRYI